MVIEVGDGVAVAVAADREPGRPGPDVCLGGGHTNPVLQTVRRKRRTVSRFEEKQARDTGRSERITAGRLGRPSKQCYIHEPTVGAKRCRAVSGW